MRDGRSDERVLVFEDHFDTGDLETETWVPHYLPAWSSRAETAASYELRDSCLHLRVPVDHPVWCEGEHTPPIRVSGIQSASWSGPVGSMQGQQRFREGQAVREEQPEQLGWTPDHGWVELRARAVVTQRSMVALWMVGLERVPEQSGEICVVEMFGDAVEPGVSAAVGMGLHPFRDPAVAEDFAAPRLPIDLAGWHTYAVRWDAERADFHVDGQLVRSCARPPAYPLQLMLAVFDFPEKSDGQDAEAVPELVVDWVRGYE